MLRLYNTLTKKIEEFKPLHPPVVTYYSCGPTVYDFAHIGHARTYVFADILQRVLEFDGFKVKRVMNITDVGHLTSDSDTGEDKMEVALRRSKKQSVWEIAKFYADDFFAMIDKLNIKKPEVVCKATDHIKEMIDLILILEKKGYTYRITDGIYFNTAKFPTYGRLTGQNFDTLQKSLKAGARIEVVSGKKHPTDFALWKFSPKGVKRQMEWESPWGLGFPGWHIECSAMSMKYLGETIDIHTGGIDHIPIHHTNEIAQSEAATGKEFVRFWLHAAHLLVEEEKMSKSLGNYYRLKDVEEKVFNPLALRYLFLTASYRKEMNFTWRALTAAANALDNLYEQVADLERQIKEGKRTVLSEEKLSKIDAFKEKFQAAIDDDLNMPEALVIVWETVKSNIPSEDKYDLLLLFDEVLGLGLKESKIRNQGSEIPEEILELINKREVLRREKKWEEADRIRKKIEKEGYQIEDTPAGSKVKKRY